MERKNQNSSFPHAFAALAVLVLLSACANNSAVEQTVSQRDPYERFNRNVYAFNDFFDRWLLKPATKTYLWLAPGFVESGVSNFFSNLDEVPNVINGALQWKWGRVGNGSGRFLLNSTLGLGGLFDPAASMGLSRLDKEDFGQTLAVWGFGSGPYLVLPFLGPSTLRDTLALPIDWYTEPLTYVDQDELRFALFALSFVDVRGQLLAVEELASGDMYTFVREAYLQRRQFLVNDGLIEDEFGDDFSEDDFDF